MKNATAGDGKIDRVLEIKFWDKTKALDMYHRLNGSYQDTEDGTAALREKMANLIGQARKRWQRFEEAEAERRRQGAIDPAHRHPSRPLGQLPAA